MNLLITQGITALSEVPAKVLKEQSVYYSLDNAIDEHRNQSLSKIKELDNILQRCWKICREELAEYAAAIQSFRHPYSILFDDLGKKSGLPLWHLTGLGKRDPEVKNGYFYNFTYLYFISELKNQGNKITIACTDEALYQALKINFPEIQVLFYGGFFSSTLSFLRSFRQGAGTLLIFLFAKFFLRNRSNIGPDLTTKVFFLSIHPISWSCTPDGLPMDRHYSTSTFRDHEFNLRTCFLIYPWPNFKKIFNFKSYVREIDHLCSQLTRTYLVLSFWKNADLLKNISLLFRAYWRVKKIPPEAFEVSGLKLEKILRSLISNYILNGEALRVLMQNAALLEVLEKHTQKNSPNILVTYDQLFPESRLLAATLPASWKLFTVQHAVEYKNKFSNYFKKSQLEGLKLPDYYFTQGNGYTEILATYFPKERIQNIGSLKYDIYFEQIKKNEKKKDRDIKTLLIAPSLEDAHIILPFFKDLTVPPGWRVLLKPHPALHKKKYEPFVLNSLTPITVVQTPVWDLMSDVDLVAFNYSSVGLEAAFWGVPSIRLSSKKVYEIFDPDEHIPCFYAPHDIYLYMQQSIPSSSPAIISFYFHKFDGLCYERFWSFIKEEMQLT